MFCGTGHFRKQEKVMRKYVRDPGADTNQHERRLINTSSSGRSGDAKIGTAV